MFARSTSYQHMDEAENQPSWWRRRWVRITAVPVLLVLVVPVTAGVALRLEDAGSLDARAHTRGRDAVWLGHAWVDGRRTEADVAALAGRIRGTGIRDMYLHAGPLNGDGSLDPAKSPRATWAPRQRFGVALYVDFAATEADWSAYRRDWCRNQPN